MGIQIGNRYYKCQREEEAVTHLFLHCQKARTLWTLIFNLFGFWLMGETIEEMMAAWKNSVVKKHKRRAWLAVPHSIIWTIWRCRTKIAFEGESWMSKSAPITFFLLFHRFHNNISISLHQCSHQEKGYSRLDFMLNTK